LTAWLCQSLGYVIKATKLTTSDFYWH